MPPLDLHAEEDEQPYNHYSSSQEEEEQQETRPFISSTPSDLGAVGAKDPRDKYRWRVLALVFSIACFFEMAIIIAMPAWAALLEQGLCGEMHPEEAASLVAGEENPLCKGPAVQGKLAMYRGWGFTIDAIPTILLSIPFGSLSDRLGRKVIGSLALCGVLLAILSYQLVFYFALPMWTFLVCSVWYILGGGPPVAASMMYTMLADVVHVEEMASVLFRFNSLFLVAELVATPIGAFLLGQSPWLSLVTSNVIMLTAMSLLYFVPETLSVRRWHDAQGRKLASPPAASLGGGTARVGGGGGRGRSKSRLPAGLRLARAEVLQMWDFVITNRRAAILIMPFVFVSLGKYLQELLLQYATKRYGWSWSKASYFLTLKSASFVVMLTWVLPYLSTLCLERSKMTPVSRDLWLSRWSALLLAAADLVLAASATPALYGLGLVLLAGGCGLPPLLRSLLNALVEPHRAGTLNTLVGFLETLGVMVAAPVFSGALRGGIELGGGWMGLPFAVGAGITCVAAALLFWYRTGQEEGERARERMDGDHEL